MSLKSFAVLVLIVGATALGTAAWSYDSALGPWAGPCAQSGGMAPGCGGGQQRQRGWSPPSGPSAEEIAHGRAETLRQEGLDASKRGDSQAAMQLLEEARQTWPNLTNIDNDIRNVQGDIERHQSGARFGGGLDAIHQDLGSQMTANNSGTDTDADLPLMPAENATPAAHRGYVVSGNALIGGMSWMAAFNVPPDAKPELLARTKAILRRLADAEGIAYNEKIDFQKYNFVLGLAASTDVFGDLASRAVFDEFSNGQFTATQQKAYNSLKGRQFDELACHSNGAMICLAALRNRDILAKHIVLFGPQITPESLYMWDELVRSGRISTLQIFVNQGDPIPASAMLASNPVAAMTVAAAPFLAAPLYNADVLSYAIKAFAPSANVKTFACGNVADLKCHDMRIYKLETGICPASSIKIVAGTGMPGRAGVIEPPPPC